MTTKPSDLTALIAAVQLNSVRLVETSAKTSIHTPKEVGEITECRVETSTQVKDALQGQSSFTVIARIHFKLAGSKFVAEPAVSVRASFELEYQLPKDFVAQQKELKAFAEINGIFNAWPYWREYIQNVFSRMSLPPITLPIYRLKNKVLGASNLPSLPKRTTAKSRNKTD